MEETGEEASKGLALNQVEVLPLPLTVDFFVNILTARYHSPLACLVYCLDAHVFTAPSLLGFHGLTYALKVELQGSPAELAIRNKRCLLDSL